MFAPDGKRNLKSEEIEKLQAIFQQYNDGVIDSKDADMALDNLYCEHGIEVNENPLIVYVEDDGTVTLKYKAYVEVVE